MLRAILILTIAISSNSYADNHSTFPFNYESVLGKWESDWTSVPGEKQTLIFSSGGATTFKREFKVWESITVSSEPDQIEVLEDILLVEYFDGKFGIRYKIVLSGWHIEENTTKASAMYGMLFLYQNGRQFNGFPVSLRPAN